MSSGLRRDASTHPDVPGDDAMRRHPFLSLRAPFWPNLLGELVSKSAAFFRQNAVGAPISPRQCTKSRVTSQLLSIILYTANNHIVIAHWSQCDVLVHSNTCPRPNIGHNCRRGDTKSHVMMLQHGSRR